MIAELNERHGIEGRCRVLSGNSGLPKIELSHESGSSAELYLHGAHVTSWKPASGKEVLFLSKRAVFSKDKPIRGGVPVIFPQFGPGVLPAHGFSRTMSWDLRETSLTAEGGVRVTLSISDDSATRALWPSLFRCELTVLLDKGLRTGLSVYNVGNKPLRFTAAFHTYFAVDDISAAALRGLSGCTYLDSFDHGRVRKESSGGELRFSEAINRIYAETPEQLFLVDEKRGCSLGIGKHYMPDAVVWNPWNERIREFKDLGPEEYRDFVCVEAAAVNRLITVQPGNQWNGDQVLELNPAQ